MDSSPFELWRFFAALTGAAVLELIYWRDIYQSREADKYKALLNSRLYWIITVAFVLGSAFGALI
jgi:hypothetical protein